MKILIDTLDLKEIKKYSDMGIISGVTTNTKVLGGSIPYVPTTKTVTTEVKPVHYGHTDIVTTEKIGGLTVSKT